MMNYGKILKRSWHILWHYPALWVIAFILAWVGGSNGGGNGGGSSYYRLSEGDLPGRENFGRNGSEAFRQFMERFNDFMEAPFRGIDERTLIAWAIGAAIFIFLIIIISVFLYYISTVAHIRMVNGYEENGEKLSWWKGLKLGWSKAAFKLWLIDLLIFIPTFAVFLILFGCAALPIILGIIGGSKVTTATGLIATIGVVLVVVFFVFVVSLVINLLTKFAHRVCLLEGSGVIESISRGWKTVIASVKDVLITWLILVGIQIGVNIASIPLVLIVIVLASFITGGFGLLLYAVITEINIAMVISGIILLILLLAIPITFMRGLLLSYTESVWTLVYRETKLTGNVQLIPGKIVQNE